MIWLTSPTATAPRLPATWLIATGQNPGALAERSPLRRETARMIVANQFGLPFDAVEIQHDPRGRPLLAHPVGTGLHLSFATRLGLVAVAIAGGSIGVDVERIDLLSAPPLSVLHQHEREGLLALPESARPLAFALLWCAKEAYVKALGLGFARAPESFAVAFTTQYDFNVHDPAQTKPVSGTSRIIGNGGQESLAAAVVVLG